MDHAESLCANTAGKELGAEYPPEFPWQQRHPKLEGFIKAV